MNVADTVTLPGLTVTNYNPTEVCHEPFKQPCYRTDQRNSGPYSSYGHRSRSCVLLSFTKPCFRKQYLRSWYYLI